MYGNNVITRENRKTMNFYKYGCEWERKYYKSVHNDFEGKV